MTGRTSFLLPAEPCIAIAGDQEFPDVLCGNLYSHLATTLEPNPG
jgi:hypothetical protein